MARGASIDIIFCSAICTRGERELAWFHQAKETTSGGLCRVWLVGRGVRALTVARMCVGPTSCGRILALSLLPWGTALMLIMPLFPTAITGDIRFLSPATASAPTGWFTCPSASCFRPSAALGPLLLRKQSNWVFCCTPDLGGTQLLAELDGAEPIA